MLWGLSNGFIIIIIICYHYKTLYFSWLKISLKAKIIPTGLFILLSKTKSSSSLKPNLSTSGWIPVGGGDCTLYRGIRSLPTKELYPEYDTRLHLSVRFQFARSGESKVPLHYHYSQVHFDLEWKYLLISYLWVKLFVFDRNNWYHITKLFVFDGAVCQKNR